MRYFAYGTNVNPAILAKKGVFYLEREVARLPGYRLRFNKQSLRPLLPQSIGFANIVEDEQGVVEGVVHRLPDAVLSKLDGLERCPEHYERIEVTVQADGAEISCVTYRAQPDKTAEGLIPSRNYLNHMLASEVFSPAYRAQLLSLDTYSGQCAACHKHTGVLFHKEAGHMYVLCPPCLEAKWIWGDALGRPLTVIDTAAVMGHVRRAAKAYDSIPALIADAVRQGLLEAPTTGASDEPAR